MVLPSFFGEGLEFGYSTSFSEVSVDAAFDIIYAIIAGDICEEWKVRHSLHSAKRRQVPHVDQDLCQGCSGQSFPDDLPACRRHQEDIEVIFIISAKTEGWS